MYPRTNYGMSKDDLKELLDACKPTPVMKIGSYTGSSPQENANRAWAKLGEKMGFDPTSVKPIPGKEMMFFTAIPSETEEESARRESAEAATRDAKEIEQLTESIAVAQDRIRELVG